MVAHGSSWVYQVWIKDLAGVGAPDAAIAMCRFAQGRCYADSWVIGCARIGFRAAAELGPLRRGAAGPRGEVPGGFCGALRPVQNVWSFRLESVLLLPTESNNFRGRCHPEPPEWPRMPAKSDIFCTQRYQSRALRSVSLQAPTRHASFPR